MRRIICSIMAAVLLIAAAFSYGGSASFKGNNVFVYAADETAGDLSVLPDGVRKELSEGVKNVLRRAWQIYDIDWSPLADISAYSSSGSSIKLFKAGEHYKGIPYGQPVHAGAYVGFNASLTDFVAAVREEESLFYTEQGMNTWEFTDHGGPVKYCPYYSSDCSAFVSYCWNLAKRTTTTGFASDPENFIVVGKDISMLEPGYALNGNGHAILIYDVVYNNRGKIISVTTLEQTPPIMVLRTFGVYGNAGTLDDLQKKIDLNYNIIKYKYVDDVTYEEIPGINSQERYVSRIMQPVSDLAEDTAATGSTRIAPESKEFPVSGWALHEDGVVSFSYTVNGGEERPLSGAYSSEVLGIKGYERYEENCGLNLFSGMISADFGDVAEIRVLAHTKKGETCEAAVFTVQKGLSDIAVQSHMDTPTGMHQNENGVFSERITRMWENVSVSFAGWSVCETDIKRFEICVDDGIWHTADTNFRNDVYSATPFVNCRNANSFNGGMDLSYLGRSAEHRVVLRAVTAENAVYEIAVWEISGSSGASGIWWIAGFAAVCLLLAAWIIILLACRKKRLGKSHETGKEEAGASGEQEKEKNCG